MILSNPKKHQGLVIQGDLAEVSAECILIMNQIYNRNKEIYGEDLALGILTNMLIKSINTDAKHDQVEWGKSIKEKLDYTE